MPVKGVIVTRGVVGRDVKFLCWGVVVAGDGLSRVKEAVTFW